MAVAQGAQHESRPAEKVTQISIACTLFPSQTRTMCGALLFLTVTTAAIANASSTLPAFSALAKLTPKERTQKLHAIASALPKTFGKDLVTVPSPKCTSKRACHPALYGDGICLVESAKPPGQYCLENVGPNTFFLTNENAAVWMRLQMKVTIACTKSPGLCKELK